VTQALRVKPGYARRATALACVAFAGCTFANHRECVEYPSIYGPCSWSHSAWQTAGIFAFSSISMTVLLAAALWVAGVIPREKR